jgi:mono/diheme cytochrome c family protein
MTSERKILPDTEACRYGAKDITMNSQFEEATGSRLPKSAGDSKRTLVEMLKGRLRSSLALLVLVVLLVLLSSCKASSPSDAESKLAAEAKKMTIGGKDWQNPTPDTSEVLKTGMEHFQHHCQICHGLDGHNTGVPFAAKMSPPVADLGDTEVRQYRDGQLKWIIENGIRFSGMPGWKGTLDDQ